MRNPRLRTSWIATVIVVIAIGPPIVTQTWSGSYAGAQEAFAGSGTRGATRSFSDLGPQVQARAAADAVAAARRAERRAEQRRRERAAGTHLLVRIPRPMAVRARPDPDAAVVGTMPSVSKYYGVPISAWVEETSKQARWGRVEIPYTWPRRDGWIVLGALQRARTHVEVRVDLSEHRLTVWKFGRWRFGLPAATGAAVSPTPPGEYFVTDRIPFPGGGSLGTFAFGISGIQPKLPPGWSGGNQLAIHGTSDPSSIGTSASAGCLRVSERGLDRLLPLLRLGTPVFVER